MVRARQLGASACAAVAVVAVLLGCLQGAPRLTRADARSYTEHTLETLGLRSVKVEDRVLATSYEPNDGADRIAVWRTTATARGGSVVLDVDKRIGQAVYVDDVSTDGTSRLLTDRQFEALGEYTSDPARDRRVTRNIAAVIAGLLVAGVAIASTTIVPRRLQEHTP